MYFSTLFFVSSFVFTGLFATFEISYLMTASDFSLDKPLFTAFYFTMVTLSTIGYGDYCPTTVEG